VSAAPADAATRRAQTLGAIRRALGRGELSGEARAQAESRLAAPQTPRVTPARAKLPQPERVALFQHWAEAVMATVARTDANGVAAEVSDYLARNNLPSEAAMAPDPALERYDWSGRPLLKLRKGLPDPRDTVAITGAFAGLAETGTLVMTSGPDHPTSLNLLPDTHVVVLREADVVGGYEDLWSRLRGRYGKDAMPRTVNTITGPSRTGDIEQQLELGAHGPRRMHIVLVSD
jgi:L-lactate dehydrogenase complex protein LldG